MRRFVMGAVPALVAAAVVVQAARHDLPPLSTEEQVEAKLRETRKQLEALRAEEQKLQKQLDAVKETPRGQIRAEVEGVLQWRDEGGMYVAVRPKGDPKREVRVFLAVCEQKVINPTRQLAFNY